MSTDILPVHWVGSDLGGFEVVAHKQQPINRDDLDPDLHLLLLIHCDSHGGYGPSVSRDHRPKLEQIRFLREVFGPLVLLRFDHSALDHLPLKSPELIKLAREKIAGWLRLIAPRLQAYLYAIQRGWQFGFTHSHIVIPLCHLSARHQKTLLEAQRGTGGGAILLHGPLRAGSIHGVILDETPEDDERVARYISRDGDCRLDKPGTPSYYDALENHLARQETGERSLPMSGAPGLRRLRGSTSM